ncbi:transglycosylase SLT domain-containing protein [Cellulosimicrobium cellulans]|uniref:transglycosylase SLT domain-containing protein n=1 Tax=Cellulosimicrobium cellulans TaxID=1710 RepID=UPI0020CE07D4|nr:transglycosylase SLT domain-containing protein [Cellulosimicrobium cellulans]
MKGGVVAAAGAPLALGALLLGMALFSDDDRAAAAPSGGSGALNEAAIPEAYRAAVRAAGERCEGISGPVIAAQIEAESNWNPTATSSAGARGIAQFMPDTWDTWGSDYSGDGVANVLDPLDAIGSQADYMCHLREWVERRLQGGAISGDPLQLTLAAYNAGPGRVQDAGGMPNITETRKYVERILANIPKYSQSAGGSGNYDTGGGPPVSADGTYREAVSGSGRLDPSNLCQIPWARHGEVIRCDAEKALEDLNAAYRAQFGDDLGITDAYRDYAAQVAVYANKPALAAKPGWSNHGWGLALDLAGIGGEGSTRHSWLRQNAPAYGWQHPTWARTGGSRPESWHWEYVGTRS